MTLNKWLRSDLQVFSLSLVTQNRGLTTSLDKFNGTTRRLS